MPYKTISLGKAITDIGGKSPVFSIPAMQRPFVWGKKDIIKLFDSIYNGYPIGSALAWETQYENPNNLGALRAYRFPHIRTQENNRIEAHLDSGEQITYVLDGQQRLTSLNIGVRGVWLDDNGTEHTLYFHPRAPEDQAFKFLDSKSSTDDYIPCADILQWGSTEAFRQYLNIKLGATTENQDIIESNLTRLRNRLWEDEAFCYGCYDAVDMGHALTVFVLANDTGTPLDKADLIIAMLTTSWNRLSAEQEIDGLKTTLNGEFSGSRPFKFRKPIVKSMLALHPDHLPIAYSLSHVNEHSIAKLEDFWSSYKTIMCDTVELIKLWGLNKNKCITSTNALIPLAYWIKKRKIKIHSETTQAKQNLESARIWFISALFSSSFGGNSDAALTTARDVLDNAPDDIFPLEQMNKAMDHHHNMDLMTKEGVTRLLADFSYSRTSNRINIRLILMLIRGTLSPAAKYELDHIYPQINSEYKNRLGDRMHSIENIELLTTDENNAKKNQSPSILWNSDEFSEEWKSANQLPTDKHIIDGLAIYDHPNRLLDYRLKKIVGAICEKLDIKK